MSGSRCRNRRSTRTRVKPKAVSIFTALRQNWQLSLYCIILMTAFNHFSHGSQDFYPTYMQYRGFTPALLGTIAILYNIGGIMGCWLIASLSQKYGRRRTMIDGGAAGHSHHPVPGPSRPTCAADHHRHHAASISSSRAAGA